MEVANPDVPEAQLRAEHGGWLDGNPFFLLIDLDDDRVATIDLGTPGWLAIFGEQGFLRAPGHWYLVRKVGEIIVAMIRVHDGDQPYYVAKHVGFVATSGGEGTETIVYGIGKKRPDGSTDRLWLLSNGAYTVGEDIEEIAIRLLKAGHLAS